MKVKRLDLIDRICRRVNLERKEPNALYLTKPELMHIYSFLEILGKQVDPTDGSADGAQPRKTT